MAGTSRGPRIVDVLAEIRDELRLANQLHALGLGASVLEHDLGARATSATARARIARRNVLRAKVRRSLGLEGEEAGRG